MVIRYMIQSALYGDIEPNGIGLTRQCKHKGSTISLLYQNGEFVDKEFAEWGIRHNMKWSDSNLFVDDSVNSLSNCCRLKCDIRDLG